MDNAKQLMYHNHRPLFFTFLLALLITGVSGKLPAQQSAFTVALIPDTQNYSQSYPATYSAQTQWIKDNADAQNIKFAIHLGDIVNSPTTAAQWQNASGAQAILDGHVPNSVLPGNHDMVNPYDPATRTSVQYNQYFGPQRYEGNSWYGGHEGTTNNNNYCFFEGGGTDFMVLSLENKPTASTLAWANGIVAAHQDRRVIVATHDYIGRFVYDEERSAIGEDIWNNLVRGNSNIFMVVNGHMDMQTSGEAVGLHKPTSLNDFGRPVHELLTDFQFWPNGGDGWLRTLRFEPAENKIYVESYSPTLDQHNTVPAFSLDYDMSDPEPVEPGVLVNHAAKVYYVGTNAADANMVAHLRNDLGHNVVQVSSTAGSYAGALAAGADLIVLSGSMGSPDASGKGYHTSAIPVVNFEPFSYDNFGWTGDVQNTDFGDSQINRDTIQIEDASHPITNGFSSGPLVVLANAAADSRFGFGVPSGDADVLATYQGGGTGNGKSTLFVYEKGDNLVGPTDDNPAVATASGRYIGFFLDYGAGVPDLYAKMNDNGKQLFDQAVQYAVAAPEPVAHWTFDQDFSDSAGDNHGTAVGGASISNTQYMSGGGALRLDQSGAQYVTVDGLAGELASGDDVTITMWINTTSKGTAQGGDMLDASDNVIFSAHTAAGGNLVRMGTGVDGGFYLNPTDIGGTAPNEEFGAGLNDGQWQFVAVTLAGDGTSTVRYYNNGYIVEIAGFTDRVGYPDWTAADLFSIGQEWDSTSASNFFDGWIDDMRVYDTALTQYQIEEIYLSAIPALVADPVPGDANRDGLVNAADAAVLAANWLSETAAWAQGDFNGDNKVDAADATLLAANWQSATAAKASVPEPATALLWLSAMISLVFFRAWR